jgi:putative transposase
LGVTRGFEAPVFVASLDDVGMAREVVAEWQKRPLETKYPLVFFDVHPGQGLLGLDPRIRDAGLVRSKAVYLAFEVAGDGTKDTLGLRARDDRGRQSLTRCPRPI